MIKRPFFQFPILFLLCLVIGCTGTENQATTEADETLIQLQAPLDEPEFYCVDVPGFGDSLNLEGALTAHTCKPGSSDELFVFNQPAAGQFWMGAYDLCMTAATATAGAELFLQTCEAERPLQQFSFVEGQIRLDNTLCLTVSPADGEPTGGPSHLRRDLLLLPCDEADPALSLWLLPGVSPDES